MQRHEKTMLIFLLKHLAYGLTGGLIFGLALLYYDIAQIRSLALRSDNPFLVIGLLFFGLFVTFGSVGMGVGIMSQGKDEY
ncbi:hypothetical protein [Telmatospirillum sp. J64-1]|uniref:hypothetical protein n=1 Tax=Telmatospirillum sp. J64-1 TaxID=2502183 RepID=UPI00115D6BAA|nr:hypothetical protein [Telmatospirillum sp. J64-1]